jgi:hypothetical protein
MARFYCRCLIWTIAVGLSLAQGCAGTSTTVTPIAVSQTVAPSAIFGPSTENQSVTAAEMAPFLGKWEGTGEWREVPAPSSDENQPFHFAAPKGSDSYESELVDLTVEMASQKPFAVWIVHSPEEEGYTELDSAGTTTRLPVKFSKRDGVVSVEFTTENGNNIQFHLKGNELQGGKTSLAYDTRCTLKKISQ